MADATHSKCVGETHGSSSLPSGTTRNRIANEHDRQLCLRHKVAGDFVVAFAGFPGDCA